MNGNIFELSQSSTFSSSNNDICLQKLLQSCSEQGVFYCKDNIETLVKTVNNSLNSNFEKEKGLSFLLVCLPQITVEAYSGNAVSWMTHCIKIINNKSNLDGLALNVLGKLIKSSSNFPEIFKETAKYVIPKFLQDNVKREKNTEVSVAFLDCLKICIQEYSGPSIEFKNDLVRLLLSGRVVEGRRDVAQSAAKCVALLAQLGGGGRQGAAHKTAWHQQQLDLVSLLHTLLNNIYQLIYCSVEKEDENSRDQPFKVEDVKDKDILVTCQRLATQFGSVCRFLQAMLLEEFPTPKQVAPDAILDVISHAQKPTHMTLGTSREELAVMAILPSIQVSALRLLEALVLSLGRNLIPQGGLVNFLCSQAIVWTNKQSEDWPYAMDKPFRHTRFAAYCCLYSWLSVSGASNQVDVLLDKPLSVMLADIHAEKPTVKLKVGSKQSKGRKQQVLVGSEERSDKLGDSHANSRLCERALLTLAQLLRAAPVLFKPRTYMNVCQRVLTVLEELPVPYSNVSCLCALYQLLLTLCSDPPANVVPPYSAALAAFTAGSRHSNTQVKTTCLSAVAYLDKVIHPVAATLYFPLPQEPMITNEDLQPQDTEQMDEDSEPEIKRMKLDSGSRDSITLVSSEDEVELIGVVDGSEPLLKKSKCDSDESMTLELSEDEKKLNEDGCISDAKSRSCDSNDDVEINYAILPEDSFSENKQTDSECNINKSVILEHSDIENNIETHKVSKPVVLVEGDANLSENQVTSSVSPSFEANKNDVEVQENNPEDQGTTEKQDVPEEMDEDISQMLSDFKDEVN